MFADKTRTRYAAREAFEIGEGCRIRFKGTNLKLPVRDHVAIITMANVVENRVGDRVA